MLHRLILNNKTKQQQNNNKYEKTLGKLQNGIVEHLFYWHRIESLF